jgi:hypothetical protein
VTRLLEVAKTKSIVDAETVRFCTLSKIDGGDLGSGGDTQTLRRRRTSQDPLQDIYLERLLQ